MDASLERLSRKIEKLIQQKQQMEEKYINAVAHLVRDRTQKGHDLSLLTGMILNADQIIKEFQNQKEAWRVVGQKFLLRSKNRNAKSERSVSTA